MGSYRFRDGGETYTEYRYRLTVYAYDKRTDRMNSYSDSGYDIESTSILNNPDDVLYPAMTRILRKLPYKRIPTDIETTGNTIPACRPRRLTRGNHPDQRLPPSHLRSVPSDSILFNHHSIPSEW